MVRANVLLALTSTEELAAFNEYDQLHNPLLLSHGQAALLLYSLIDNDAAMTYPLFHRLLELSDAVFDERTAGDMLPEIIRQGVKILEKKSLTGGDRERLAQVEQVAVNIAKQQGKPYSGGGAREHYVRPRLEPYCDLGLLSKPDKSRFVYQVTPALRSLLQNWSDLNSTDTFLNEHFFASLSALHGLPLREASDDEARLSLQRAGEQLKSTLGYSPIIDVALLAGIDLLFEQGRVFEVASTTRLLKEWQKQAPDLVRFSVDRMGALAYLKFLKPLPIAAERAHGG